jgi:hypothetical protein
VSLRVRLSVIALCENGVVVRKLARHDLVAWDSITGLRARAAKYTTYLIEFDGRNALLVKHPASVRSLIEQRTGQTFRR